MDRRRQELYATREEIERLLEETRSGADQALGVKKGLFKKQPVKKKLTKAQRVRRAVFNGVYCAVVLFLAVLLFIGIRAKKTGQLPGLFGYHIFTVKTGSMIPTLPIGSYIVVKDVKDPAAIEAGTVVTFYFEDGTIVTHRVIERCAEDNGGVSYITKGDNPANDPDPERLVPERVIGALAFKITLPTLWKDGG